MASFTEYIITYEQIAAFQHYFSDAPNLLLLYAAVCLMLLSLGAIAVLYARRVVLSGRDKKISQLKFTYQYLIYEALVESQTAQGISAQQLIVEKLKHEMGKTALHTQVLAELLIDLKKNFSGEAAQQFTQLYHALQLDDYSFEKLNSKEWYRQAQGIRELTEMSSKDLKVQLTVSALQQAEHAIVAQEARTASVKLEKQPLSFLQQLQEPLTAWQQINLHGVLLKAGKKQLPDFTQWLDAANESVVIFALKMLADFDQQQAGEAILHRFSGFSAAAAKEAIQTLVHLDAAQHIPSLLACLEHCEHQLHIEVIDTVLEQGVAAHIALLAPLTAHASADIRQAATAALQASDRQMAWNVLAKPSS